MSSFARVKRFINCDPEPWADHAETVQHQRQINMLWEQYHSAAGGGKGALLEGTPPPEPSELRFAESGRFGGDAGHPSRGGCSHGRGGSLTAIWGVVP